MQNQVSEIRIFTENQAALRALEDPNRCSKLQIMQTITRHIDDLRNTSTGYLLTQKYRGMKRRKLPLKKLRDRGEQKEGVENGKSRTPDTQRKGTLTRALVTVKLASERKTLELWERAL